MNTWRNFLDSIGSRGGSVLVLLVITVLLFAGLMHVMHHGDTGESASLVRNAFAGFSGALLAMLNAIGKANNKGTSISAEVKLDPGDPIPPLRAILPIANADPTEAK
jgi:hypothetical protein